MRNKNGIWVFGAMLIFMALMVSGAAHATETRATVQDGEILITVVDSHGNAVQNATVELMSNATQVIATATTASNGQVSFSGLANFTGYISVSKKGYDTVTQNITYNNTNAYTYTITLHSNSYVQKAKNIYEQHKMAVIVGGAIIIFLVILMVMAGGKKIRW